MTNVNNHVTQSTVSGLCNLYYYLLSGGRKPIAMRPLLSYDDIASEVPIKEAVPSNGGPATPPKKRRKTNHHQGQRFGGQRNQSREDDREDGDEVSSSKKSRTRYGLQEESRQLTHDEVWDDSALIRAWDAAVEEYEVR